MKKLLVIAAALVLMGTQAQAQLIFNAGYLHATETTKHVQDQTTKVGAGVLDGFYTGAKYRFKLDGITEGLSIAPGANFSFLFGVDGGLPDVLDDAKTTEVALNVPLHVQYLFEITPDFKLEAWAGPTFQVGIYNRTIDGTGNPTYIFNQYQDIPANVNVDLGGAYGAVPARSRINLFLGLGLGFEVAELVHVNVGYDFGLLNLSKGVGYDIRRGLLRVGVGYNF